MLMRFALEVMFPTYVGGSQTFPSWERNFRDGPVCPLIYVLLSHFLRSYNGRHICYLSKMRVWNVLLTPYLHIHINSSETQIER
jgi:hypothetical protein